jgi:hypothetical protein
MSDEQKTKMLQVVVENLGHPAAGIRRASLKTVQELQVVSNQAIEGIISCLARGSQDLQQDALNALAQLLGKTLFCFNLQTKIPIYFCRLKC